MRTSVLENQHGSRQIALLADRRMAGGGNDHQFLVKREGLLERHAGDRLGDQGCVELTRQDRTAQHLRVSGAQFQHHPGMPPVVFAEQPRQPDRRRALHRAEPERPARSRILDGAVRFLGQRQQALGIAEQYLASRRKVQPFTLANEQRDRKILLQLPDPGRDIGLHAMQPLSGARHAAFAHHCTEDHQVRQVHSSLHEIRYIIIIHFM